MKKYSRTQLDAIVRELGFIPASWSFNKKRHAVIAFGEERGNENLARILNRKLPEGVEAVVDGRKIIIQNSTVKK